jgi:hypothetical protein
MVVVVEEGEMLCDCGDDIYKLKKASFLMNLVVGLINNFIIQLHAELPTVNTIGFCLGKSSVASPCMSLRLH